MALLNNLRITFKLPAMMVLLVAAAVILLGVLVNRFESRNADAATEQRIEVVLAASASGIEGYFQELGADLDALATESLTGRAISQFERGWALLGDNAATELRRQYIDENPHPPGERQNLDRASEASSYSSSHAEFHGAFLGRIDQRGYYDIFLFDTKGNLLYTVVKENDFATNMLTGEWKDSGLAKAFRGAMEADQGEQVFVDYENYAPSLGAAASFLAQPVFLFGQKIGVVAVQMPDTEINAIVESRAGLGETAEFVLVGPDELLRSNRIGVESPTILQERFEGEATDRALAGDSGFLLTENRDGVTVFRSYRPIRVFGNTWAAVVDIDEAEALAAVTKMQRMLMLGGLAAIAAASVLGFVFSSSLSRPLQRVTTAVSQISEGVLETKVLDAGRRDEIGQIAARLEELRRKLLQAEEDRVQSAFRGAAFGASTAAIMMVNKDLVIFQANDSIRMLLAAHPDAFRLSQDDAQDQEIEGTPLGALLPTEILARVEARLESPATLPGQVSAALGELRLLIDLAEVKGADGTSLGFVVEVKDITSTFLNRAVMESIDGFQVRTEIAPDHRMLDANDTFCELVGLARDEIVGRSPDQFIRFADKEAALGSLRAGKPVIGRFEIPRPSKGDAVVDGAITPVKDADGVLLRHVMIATDVTDAQTALAEAERQRKAHAEAQAKVVDGLRTGLGKLASGDLTVRIESVFEADYEKLRSDFNDAATVLLETIRAVAANALEVRGGAAEISSAADDLSTRTERQAATLEETAASLDTLTSSVRVAAEGASEANRIVADARANAERSGEVVRGAVSAMSELEQSSKQISKITAVIDDISYQTNLLALNAGVEAARAGEAGRGFAVVASEVRALAQRSSDAAREINELITSSGRQVKRGVDLVGQAGDALQSIVDGVVEISRHVSQIAESSRSQSTGLAEINVAVGELDKVTQQNAAMFEETTAAGHSLSREAEAMTEAMARFRTDAGIEAAKGTSTRTISSDAPKQLPATKISKTATSPTTRVTAAAASPALRTTSSVAAAPVAEFEDEEGWRDF